MKRKLFVFHLTVLNPATNIPLPVVFQHYCAWHRNFLCDYSVMWRLQLMLQVVLVVAANQQMRSTTNLLIINLAVADLLFIVFCVPFTATDYVLPFWPFGDIWCKIVQYLIVVTAYASVYTLVLMSLDRFLAVVHPITSMSVSHNYVWYTTE